MKTRRLTFCMERNERVVVCKTIPRVTRNHRQQDTISFGARKTNEPNFFLSSSSVVVVIGAVVSDGAAIAPASLCSVCRAVRVGGDDVGGRVCGPAARAARAPRPRAAGHVPADGGGGGRRHAAALGLHGRPGAGQRRQRQQPRLQPRRLRGACSIYSRAGSFL